MTKIITSENRIIFDGHASTREECETISLVCEELTKSDKFKTVKYESGYAEFEKVGNTNDLKFPPAMASDWTVTFYLDGVLKSSIVKKISKEMVDDEDNVSVNGSIATVNLLIAGGYETYEYDYGVQLDSATLVSGTGEVGPGYSVYAISKPATSRKSVDLTTLPGWEALSDGTHSITVVAKADGYKDSEPSSAVNVEKAAPEYTDCITFTGETSDFTLKAKYKEWDGTVEYSTDHNTWAVWDGTEISSVDKKLYLRGSGNTTFYTSNGAKFALLSARAACSGNIQTLLEYSNPPAAVANSCYRNMFNGCTLLTQAPELPATTLADYCYYSMFNGCSNLTAAPELPATTLASNCYRFMFTYCTKLTQAPELPATTLADYCYMGMFNSCKSLTAAPELPATTLAINCYYNMFSDCTSLKISTTQSSEYPTAWRIPSTGTIQSTAKNWNYGMLSGTGGTFTSNPSINTTYYSAWTKQS